jgi:hypothetical protein
VGWLTSFLIGILYQAREREDRSTSEQGEAGMTEAMSRSARTTAIDNFELTTLYVVAASWC